MLLSLRGWWCWVVDGLSTNALLALWGTKLAYLLKKILSPLQWKARWRNNQRKIILIWTPSSIFQKANLLWVNRVLHIRFPVMWLGKSHVVHRLDSLKSSLLKKGIKIVSPVVRRYDDCPILLIGWGKDVCTCRYTHAHYSYFVQLLVPWGTLSVCCPEIGFPSFGSWKCIIVYGKVNRRNMICLLYIRSQ